MKWMQQLVAGKLDKEVDRCRQLLMGLPDGDGKTRVGNLMALNLVKAIESLQSGAADHLAIRETLNRRRHDDDVQSSEISYSMWTVLWSVFHAWDKTYSAIHRQMLESGIATAMHLADREHFDLLDAVVKKSLKL